MLLIIVRLLQIIYQEEQNAPEEPADDGCSAPLPILCVEDGMAILKFSEIFGIHEPLKKAVKRDRPFITPKGPFFWVL